MMTPVRDLKSFMLPLMLLKIDLEWDREKSRLSLCGKMERRSSPSFCGSCTQYRLVYRRAGERLDNDTKTNTSMEFVQKYSS